jgi:hypothetical protein
MFNVERMKKFRGVPNHGTFLWRLNNLQPYPQPGGYQAPEEDEDAYSVFVCSNEINVKFLA